MNERYSQQLLRTFGAAMIEERKSGGPAGVVNALLVNGGPPDEESGAAVGIMARISADWAESGFATVRCAPRLGESMMATRVPGEALPEQLAPWRTTFLELPTNTLRAHELTPRNGWVEAEYYAGVILQNFPGGDEHLRLGIQSTHVNWVLWPFSSAMGLHAPLKARSISELAELAESIRAYPGTIFGEKRDADERDEDTKTEAVETTVRMLIRFVVGCLLELNGDSNSRALAAHQRVGPPRIRKTKDPVGWVFKLTRSVSVDVREHVCAASARGERLATTVQSLVRGHWKNQPHGPGATERKFIHIEPYWRGPEDAPIAVRPHVLKSPKGKSDDCEGSGAPNAAE